MNIKEIMSALEEFSDRDLSKLKMQILRIQIRRQKNVTNEEKDENDKYDGPELVVIVK